MRESGVKGPPLLMQVSVSLFLILDIGTGAEPLRQVPVVVK
jgi:hypothetical protein